MDEFVEPLSKFVLPFFPREVFMKFPLPNRTKPVSRDAESDAELVVETAELFFGLAEMLASSMAKQMKKVDAFDAFIRSCIPVFDKLEPEIKTKKSYKPFKTLFSNYENFDFTKPIAYDDYFDEEGDGNKIDVEALLKDLAKTAKPGRVKEGYLEGILTLLGMYYGRLQTKSTKVIEVSQGTMNFLNKYFEEILSNPKKRDDIKATKLLELISLARTALVMPTAIGNKFINDDSEGVDQVRSRLCPWFQLLFSSDLM